MMVGVVVGGDGGVLKEDEMLVKTKFRWLYSSQQVQDSEMVNLPSTQCELIFKPPTATNSH